MFPQVSSDSRELSRGSAGSPESSRIFAPSGVGENELNNDGDRTPPHNFSESDSGQLDNTLPSPFYPNFDGEYDVVQANAFSPSNADSRYPTGTLGEPFFFLGGSSIPSKRPYDDGDDDTTQWRRPRRELPQNHPSFANQLPMFQHAAPNNLSPWQNGQDTHHFPITKSYTLLGALGTPSNIVSQPDAPLASQDPHAIYPNWAVLLDKHEESDGGIDRQEEEESGSSDGEGMGSDKEKERGKEKENGALQEEIREIFSLCSVMVYFKALCRGQSFSPTFDTIIHYLDYAKFIHTPKDLAVIIPETCKLATSHYFV
jgi:hypothetical protein